MLFTGVLRGYVFAAGVRVCDLVENQRTRRQDISDTHEQVIHR